MTEDEDLEKVRDWVYQDHGLGQNPLVIAAFERLVNRLTPHYVIRQCDEIEFKTAATKAD